MKEHARIRLSICPDEIIVGQSYSCFNFRDRYKVLCITEDDSRRITLHCLTKNLTGRMKTVDIDRNDPGLRTWRKL